jgi:hypothetical protein
LLQMVLASVHTIMIGGRIVFDDGTLLTLAA